MKCETCKQKKSRYQKLYLKKKYNNNNKVTYAHNEKNNYLFDVFFFFNFKSSIIPEETPWYLLSPIEIYFYYSNKMMDFSY